MGVRFLSSLLLLSLLSVSRAVSDEKAIEAVVQSTEKLIQHFGWKKEEVEISRVDTRDAQVAEAYIYELDIDLEGSIVPIRFGEDITSWRYLQPLPEAGENLNRPAELPQVPVLSPFQLAGPVELWIQDAKDVRLAVPHDVDAGALNRVVLADGATVTITGARELSLARPFKVPLPLVGDEENIVSVSEQLRDVARGYEKPLISLRVVGASSLTTSSSSSPEDQPQKHLKVKRLAPGAVEIVNKMDSSPSIELEGSEAKASRSPWLWPLPSVNSSDTKLVNVERVLRLFLGSKASEDGSFSIVRAKASAVRFYRVEFEVVKKLQGENSTSSMGSLPEWATKPAVQRQQFELLARVEGEKVSPVTIKPLESYQSVTTTAFAWDDLAANITSSARGSSFFPPASPFTLNV